MVAVWLVVGWSQSVSQSGLWSLDEGTNSIGWFLNYDGGRVMVVIVVGCPE